MTLRNFSSTAVSTTLAGGVTATGASMTVGSTTGFPAAPFTVIVDKDTTSEEVCEVTALSGLLLTVTRGIDGTTASAHSAGAGVIHGVSGRDFSESNTHVNTSSLHVPSQSGAAGMFVRSDGTTASWQSVAESDVTGLTADLAAKAVVGSAVPLVDGVAAAGSAVDASHEDHVHPTDTSLAPLASPAFSGTPTAPTPTAGDSDTSIATTAFVQAEKGFVAGRNRVLNGDFGIWQRGTSFTAAGYHADRFTYSGGSGFTISRQAFTPGAGPVVGYEGRYFLNCTLTASNQNAELIQRVEDARTFAGQTVTLSFWARSTVGSQAIGVGIFQNFGTGGSPSGTTGSTYVSGSTGNSQFTPTSAWTRYTFTFSVPSVAGMTFGTNNDSYLWVRIAQFSTTAANTSLDIWGVQLEAGSVATPFTTATGNQANELAACQRYYWRSIAAQAYTYLPGLAGAVSATAANVGIALPVRMRALPTAIDWGGGLTLSTMADSRTAVTSLTLATTGLSLDNAGCSAGVAGGLTANAVYRLQAGNDPTTYIGVSAEL